MKLYITYLVSYDNKKEIETEVLNLSFDEIKEEQIKDLENSYLDRTQELYDYDDQAPYKVKLIAFSEVT